MYLRTLSLIFLVTVLNVDAGKSKKVLLTAKQAQNIAIEAYIYGYSIITGEITRVQMTNVNERQTYKAPMGQFVNMRHYPSASFRGITTPNADTLYSTAWIDLDDEPWVFSHPDMGNRYFLFPMYDHWMPIIESPGTRTTGSSAATYLLTGPKWNGTLSSQLKPRITKHIRSPSRYLFILGRTYCLGTPEDYAAVHRLQDQYFLRPFSVFSSNKYQTAQEYNPPVPKVNLNYGFSMTDKVRDVINNMNITTYFNMLATLMKDNPPAKEDADIVKKMAQLGLIPGKTFDWKKLNRKLQNALKSVPKLAFNTIKSFESKSGRIQNGWTIPKIPDHYGTDYRLRAFIAAYGWPANLPEDAIYICTHVDSSGKKLSGKYNYTLRFPKGQTPPIKAFWSITMYDPEYFFVPNTLNKFTLSPRDPLVYNTKDGSLDLYFQHAAPDENKRANWLPSPQDGFILMLRMYWPQIQNSSWTIPPVKRV